MNPPLDPLDELLDRARAVPEPPPNLAAKVRRRIAEQRANPPLTWTMRLDAVFARPSFAATFIAACVLFGLFLAEARVAQIHAERSAEVARSYLQLINPLLPPAPSNTLAQATR